MSVTLRCLKCGGLEQVRPMRLNRMSLYLRNFC